MSGRLVALALALLLAQPAVAQEAPPEPETLPEADGAPEVALAVPGTAVLQGLDKITARISTFEAPVGDAVRFGSLEIVARACHKRPPEEPPESAAFLEIVDVRPDSPAVPLFTGWMFASSPSISAVEHAVYDVWVIDCKNRSSSEELSSE
ncbi:MAG: DUF2155 domain-containing protein [Pseudomonadota bacterium]